MDQTVRLSTLIDAFGRIRPDDLAQWNPKEIAVRVPGGRGIAVADYMGGSRLQGVSRPYNPSGVIVGT